MADNYGHNKTTKKKQGWDVKESTNQTNPSTFERVDLDPFKFDLLIAQKGVKAKVYRTLYCPNVKSVDGAEHEIDCTFCNGSGFLDVDPICTFVFIKTQALQNMPNIEGLVDGNTVIMTFPIGVELHYFTKIELEDFTDVYHQRVNRNPSSAVDVLKYRACRVNVLIDKDNVRYFQGQDFTLDVNGNVLWNGNRAPEDGTPYSIHYECHVQYRTRAASHANRFTQVLRGGTAEFIKMPEEWYCTKEFLVKRLDRQGVELEQGPYSEHEIVDEDA